MLVAYRCRVLKEGCLDLRRGRIRVYTDSVHLGRVVQIVVVRDLLIQFLFYAVSKNRKRIFQMKREANDGRA